MFDSEDRVLLVRREQRPGGDPEELGAFSSAEEALQYRAQLKGGTTPNKASGA